MSEKAVLSIKDLAETVAALGKGEHRHWVSPYFEVKMVRGGPGIGGNTVTVLQILNPDAEPVDVQVDFFDRDGSLAFTKMLKAIPARGTEILHVFAEFFMEFPEAGEPGGTGGMVGWLELVGTKPVYPTGNVGLSRLRAPIKAGEFEPPRNVGFAMHFYPVAD